MALLKFTHPVNEHFVNWPLILKKKRRPRGNPLGYLWSDHLGYINLMDQYHTADGGGDIRWDVAVAGEPFIPHVEILVNRGKPISVYEYWQLNRERIDLQKIYLDKWTAARSPSENPSISLSV
ncbi:hypothetical protein BJY00DRAFT_294948 [Aspergillus carlsbadensis]|nr:hypothetical protein BJY00DRAFT_294948 [Aspergillus carlsbadensis]